MSQWGRKSTLLMLLMGLLWPDEGEILVGETRLSRRNLPLIRQRLGMVFHTTISCL